MQSLQCTLQKRIANHIRGGVKEQITSTNESPPTYASNVVTICTLHTVHVTTNQAYCFIRCKYFTISCKQTRTQQVQTPFPGLTHREEGDCLLALSHEDFGRLVRDTSLPKQLIYVAESTRIEVQQRTIHKHNECYIFKTDRPLSWAIVSSHKNCLGAAIFVCVNKQPIILYHSPCLQRCPAPSHRTTIGCWW